jgi:hypothetical protein
MDENSAQRTVLKETFKKVLKKKKKNLSSVNGNKVTFVGIPPLHPPPL